MYLRSASQRKQRGVAGMMFLILLPALLGLMVLSIEGGRYLRLKAVVSDVAETVSLAISANEGETLNSKVAKLYLETLVPEANLINIQVTPVEGSPAGNRAADSDRAYSEYELEFVASYKSLIPARKTQLPLEELTVENPVAWGFEREVRMTTRAVSRKYQGGESGDFPDALDLLVVPDLSNTMNCPWDYPDYPYCPINDDKLNAKIETVRQVVGEVSGELVSHSDVNRVALVPYHYFTTDYSLPENPPVEQHCFARQQMNSSTTGRTLKHMFEEKNCWLYSNFDGLGEFHTIPLTSDVTGMMKSYQTMKPGWGTASFEGIIRASQVALEGQNPNRLVLVISNAPDSTAPGFPLSEGGLQDTPSVFHSKLLAGDSSEHGTYGNYCDELKARFDDEKTSSGEDVNFSIAVIGYDYDVGSNENLNRCVGKDNVYAAHDAASLREKIDKILGAGGSSSGEEEIGHLYRKN